MQQSNQNNAPCTLGRVHSTYMGGMVDGPGIRFVLFLAGCRLRCQYCHNPDTWDKDCGEVKNTDELVRDIERYQSYLRFSGGGVTASGGEPLLQAKFLEEFFQKCQNKGLHTALETCGYMSSSDWDAGAARRILTNTDLVLLDIKAFDDAIHKKVTNVSNRRILNFLRLCEEMKKNTWIRFVLVPGLTDNDADLYNMAEFLKDLTCVEKVDVLPFHKAGEYKWVDMGLPYNLADTQPPSIEEVARVQKIFTH